MKAEKSRQARERKRGAGADHSGDATEKVCAECGRPVLPPRREYCSAACCRKAGRRKSINRASEIFKKIRPVAGLDRKLRTCLRCNAEFMSEGPWNRQCLACTKRNEKWPVQTMRTAHQSKFS